MTKRAGVALGCQRENGAVRCDQGPGQIHALGDRAVDISCLLWRNHILLVKTVRDHGVYLLSQDIPRHVSL